MQIVAAALALLLPLEKALAVSSTRLRGTIDKGYGEINLLQAGVQSRNLTMAQLEAFRRDNNGVLAFAVDVNEAASGSEKASSQGVTVEYARVEVTTGAGVLSFDQFETQTQTSVARAGQTARGMHYTLIGDAGSRQITGSTSSDISGSSFDATIRIPVSADLSTATAARLIVKLLDTNTSLGDPEAFYDYSSGFEDVAIASAADAAVLDQLAPGRTEAPLVITSQPATTAAGRVYFPAADQFYLAAYEDQYPNRGDYDFNDLVVAYRTYYELDVSDRVVAVGGEGYLVARGGGFDSDWHLRLPLPSSASGSGTLSVYAPGEASPMGGYPKSISFKGAPDLKIFVSLATLWRDGSSPFVNTPKDQGLVPGHRFAFHLTLGAGLPAGEMPAAPFDPYLYVYNTGSAIHLPSGSSESSAGQPVFSDATGYPFALILPEGWNVPVEYMDLGLAYPDFIGFAAGAAAKQDWYLRPAADRTKATAPSVWKW